MRTSDLRFDASTMRTTAQSRPRFGAYMQAALSLLDRLVSPRHARPRRRAAAEFFKYPPVVTPLFRLVARSGQIRCADGGIPAWVERFTG